MHILRQGLLPLAANWERRKLHRLAEALKVVQGLDRAGASLAGRGPPAANGRGPEEGTLRMQRQAFVLWLKGIGPAGGRCPI